VRAHRWIAVFCLALSIVIAGKLATWHNRAVTSHQTETGRASRPVDAGKFPSTARLAATLVPRLPVSFEENRGQFDSRINFVSRAEEYGLFISAVKATIVHHGKARVSDGADPSSVVAALANSEVPTRSVMELSWRGANPRVRPRGAGMQTGESNYLIGKDPRKWQRHVPRYDRVKLAGLYPGIDLAYHGAESRVELDYTLAPHADPKAIQIGIGGPSLVSLDASGNLSISSAGDEMLLLPPVAYQEKSGRREIVRARYVLADSHRVGFELGEYDRSRPLVIDPILAFAATFGTGSNSSIISDVTLDSTGNIYLTGTTCDTNYPTTSGAFQISGGSNTAVNCYDAFVTKLNPTATELVYSTYLGGQTSDDFGSRLLVDTAGEATVTGATTSTDFPTTAGAYQTSLKIGTCNYSAILKNKPCSDAFLLKLSADGSTLVYSTLFGGERIEIPAGLTQDSNGNSYISGGTNSIVLPVSSNSYSSTYGGGTTCQSGQVPCFDGFIAKISADGTQLLASTYLGGSDDDYASAVALDTTGSVFVTGTTDSINFPTTAGAYLTTHTGPVQTRDAYLAKFDSNLHTLQYSTYFGGSADDVSLKLRLDSSGAAYITGSTLSPDLPTTTGAYQTTYKGAPAGTIDCGIALDSGLLAQPTCGDVFVAKIDPSKTGAAQLVFSTYLGGSSNDFAYNLALDSQKNVWVTGDTNSADFPTTPDAYFSPSSLGGLFLSELKSDGTQLLFSTMLSRVPFSSALALGITIDSFDDVYVAGQGNISPTPGTYASGSNLYVMEFVPGLARPGVQLSANSISFPGLTTPVGATTAPQSVTVTNNGTATLHMAISLLPPQVGTSNSGQFSEYDNCGSTLAAHANCTINAIYQPVDATGNPDTGTIQILDDAPGAPHIVTLSGASGTIDSASFVPATLTFNGQAPGTTSAAQSASLGDPGSLPTALLPVTTGLPAVSGPNASEFSINSGSPSNCPVATHFCLLSVTFSPAPGATGPRTATVSVPTAAATSPQMLSLVGNVSTGPFAVFPFPPAISPTVVGQTLNTSLLVKNSGGLALSVTGVTPSGPNQADFVLSNVNCSGVYPAFTLVSQGSCLLNLAFKPSAHGTESATFTLVDNETTPAAITFTGYGEDSTGPGLVIEYSPFNPVNGQILFPDTVVNTSTFFTTETVTLQNLGNASVQVTSFNLTGDFTQTNTCQAAIVASNTCAYTVHFAPTQTGLRTGSLTIVTNAPGGQTFTVNFAGNGVQIPVATVTPANINFGVQSVGTTSAGQIGTVTNSGGATLNLSNVTLTGPFTMTPTTCAATVAASSSCTYTLKFAPTAAGPANGTLMATTNSAGAMSAIALSGIGVTGPVVKAQPATLTFGNQAIGSQSTAQAITLSNAGDTAFTIAGIHATENFSESNSCPSSLGAGAGCSISVTYAPTTDVLVGGFARTNGNIFVTTSAPGSPFSIPVVGAPIASSGTATNVAIASSVNPSTAGQSVTLTATMTPASGSGTPSGTATFFDSGNALGPAVTLTSAKATFPTSTLPSGLNSITVSYSGDSTFAPANSSEFLQRVNSSGTTGATTTLISSVNPSIVGQSVTFTATVQPSSGTLVPTGTVAFLDGSTQIGAGVLNSSGVATVLAAFTTAGIHSITASYGGDTTFGGSSSSPALSQVVGQAPTSTAVASSANPSGVSQAVTFTATVTVLAPGTGIPTGTVSFLDGSTLIGSGALNGSGAATAQETITTAGTHSITASYAGDRNFNGSTFSAFTQTVNANPPSFTMSGLSASSEQVVAGHNASPFTFTVTPQSGSKQTVTFACSGLPVKAGCLFQPTSVTLDGVNTSAPVSVTIITTANTLAIPVHRIQPPADWTNSPRWTALGLLALSIALFVAGRKKLGWMSAACLLLLLITSLPGCNSSSYSGTMTTYNGTPPGTSAVTVTGVGNPGPTTATAPGTVTLTVTAQ
jgi:hypothetical protein